MNFLKRNRNFTVNRKAVNSSLDKKKLDIYNNIISKEKSITELITDDKSFNTDYTDYTDYTDTDTRNCTDTDTISYRSSNSDNKIKKIYLSCGHVFMYSCEGFNENKCAECNNVFSQDEIVYINSKNIIDISAKLKKLDTNINSLDDVVKYHTESLEEFKKKKDDFKSKYDMSKNLLSYLKTVI